MAKEKFQRTKPHVNVGTLNGQRLQQLGISAIGAEQVLNGQMVTDPADRTRLAEFINQTFEDRHGRSGRDDLSFKNVLINRTFG